MSTQPNDVWSPSNPWGHDPEVCGTMDCPGCYAAAYVPPVRSDEEREAGEIVMLCAIFPELMRQTPEELDRGAARLLDRLRADSNGDRAEDTEAGIVRPSDAAFYTDENGG